MAIQAYMEPRVKWWTVAYLLVCIAIGIWGWYDYAIRLPRNQAQFDRYVALSEERAQIQQRDPDMLTQAQRDRYAEVDDELAEFGVTAPQEPAKWDRPVKLWLYVILSGVFGVVWFGTSLFRLARKTYRLEDDGTLVMRDARWTRDQIADIDMSRWMEKSIATVVHVDGTRVKLDAYKYRDLHLIIGEIAHRFEPTRWHRDGRMVKPSATTEADGGDVVAEAGADAHDDPMRTAASDGVAGGDDASAAPAADGAGPTDPTRT